MLEVTEAAQKQISDYFKEEKVMPIRIFLKEGCGGSSFAMALDEARDTDNIYDIDGFQYIVDKNFMEKAKPIKIDFKKVGFQITSCIDLGCGCSGCGSDSSCCS